MAPNGQNHTTPPALSATISALRLTDQFYLRNIHLRVPVGGRAAIIGENGAGKTSLMLTVAGIRRKGFAGHLQILGTPAGPDVTDNALAELRRRIGFLFQQAFVELESTCAQNVAAMAAIRRLPRNQRRRAVDYALAQVGLKQRANDRAAHLNGGDKRLLALARALVGTTDGILFCDEPTANLSSSAAERLLGLLTQLTDSKRYTVVIVTHDSRWARRFTDAVYRIEDDTLKKVVLLDGQRRKQMLHKQQARQRNRAAREAAKTLRVVRRTKRVIGQIERELAEITRKGGRESARRPSPLLLPPRFGRHHDHRSRRPRNGNTAKRLARLFELQHPFPVTEPDDFLDF